MWISPNADHRAGYYTNHASPVERAAWNAAMEVAAKLAETVNRKVVGRDLNRADFDPCGRWEGGAVFDHLTDRAAIVAAIKSKTVRV